MTWLHFHQRSQSREGQLSSLRQTVQSVAMFSAQIHITVTMLSPNNVSEISAQVLKVSWLCPERAGQRRPDDEKMTDYQGLTVQLGVMYTVCAHQGRSHRCLSTNPAASWQAGINRAGMHDTSPWGAGPPRGRWVHSAGSFGKTPRASQMCTYCSTGCRQGFMMVVYWEDSSVDYTCCLDIFQGSINPPVVYVRVKRVKRAD